MANKKASGLTLDDVTPGQRFTSASHIIDADQIKAFAREFDPQPFHLDEEAAKETFFAGLAASGWHVAAITMKLLVGDAAHFEGGVIGRGDLLAETNSARRRSDRRKRSFDVTPSRSRPDRGMVTMRSETRNQRGEVAQVLTAKLMVPRRVKAQVCRRSRCAFSLSAPARWAGISAAGWPRRAAM